MRGYMNSWTESVILILLLRQINDLVCRPQRAQKRLALRFGRRNQSCGFSPQKYLLRAVLPFTLNLLYVTSLLSVVVNQGWSSFEWWALKRVNPFSILSITPGVSRGPPNERGRWGPMAGCLGCRGCFFFIIINNSFGMIHVFEWDIYLFIHPYNSTTNSLERVLFMWIPRVLTHCQDRCFIRVIAYCVSMPNPHEWTVTQNL